MTTSLWRNTQYVLWLISDTSKGLSQTLFAFAIPLIALIVTNDPAQAGIIGGLGMATRVALTVVGGVLADRHRRIALMVLGSSVGIVLSAAFTLLALGDALTFGVLLVLDVLLAARTGLFDTAGEAALKDIVAPETMGRAMAANQARDAAMQLAGGPLGGALLVVGGWLVGAVMTLGHLVAAATAWLIPRVRGAGTNAVQGEAETGSEAGAVGGAAAGPGAVVGTDAVAGTDAGSEPAEQNGDAAGAASAPSRSALREIREGFSWLFSRPDLRGVLIVLTLINLGINTAITTVIYALQQDGHSPAVIGWLSAGLGVTMLIGAVGASWIVTRVGAGVLLCAGLIALTAGAATVTLVREPLGVVLVLAVPGLILAPLNAALGGYGMVATPTGLVGRVNSAWAVFGMGALPLAPLIAGFGLSLAGRTGTILIGAAICAVAAVLAVSQRPLRSLPAEAGWEAHARQFESVELVDVRR